MKQIHDNTRLSYAEGLREGLFSARERAILSVLENARSPLEDREIMQAIGFRDMNAVRPRVTELIQAGVLEERGTTIDQLTRKNVRMVRIAKPRPTQLELLGVA
jgi:hypothetical protein